MDLKNGTEVRVKGSQGPAELQQRVLTLGPGAPRMQLEGRAEGQALYPPHRQGLKPL